MGRKSKGRKLKKNIRIYCEGKTEKLYFDMLSRKYNTSVSIKTFHVAKSGHKLIEHAIRDCALFDKSSIEKKAIIFDKDELDNEVIDSVVRMAINNDFLVGFSNINFEVWLLMHFQDVQHGYEKSVLNQKLEQYTGVQNYHATKGSLEVVNQFEDYVNDAMLRGLRSGSLERNNYTQNPYTNLTGIIETIYHQRIY
ncbi:RloB family protein [Fundicoccus culcitae]|uniref:RloB family protein n=1 Tax=Fundicoccus culcitae TaxID=2969821 RepID=A0ABY5P8W4_9LACT|nr:RloB family protein [Fundicoccus culcitae]UUX35197.1 RloB family protein [Fundicoccus culcitae]